MPFWSVLISGETVVYLYNSAFARCRVAFFQDETLQQAYYKGMDDVWEMSARHAELEDKMEKGGCPFQESEKTQQSD